MLNQIKELVRDTPDNLLFDYDIKKDKPKQNARKSRVSKVVKFSDTGKKDYDDLYSDRSKQ